MDAPTPSEMPASYGYFGASAALGGTQLVWSGTGPSSTLGSTWTRTGGTWSPRCGTTVAGASDPCGPTPRVHTGVAASSAGIIIFGGMSATLGTPGAVGYGDTWVFDDGSGTWTEVCNDAQCGIGFKAGFAMGGGGLHGAPHTLVYGGFTGPGAPAADTWLYDPTGATPADKWIPICGTSVPGATDPCAPGPLAGAQVAWDGDEYILFGGFDETGPVADTWSFDVGTSTWTQVCGEGMTPCGPPGRTFHTMAPIAGTDDIVMAGGGIFTESGQTVFRDVWTWDGSAWSEESVPWDSTPVDIEDDPAAAAGCGLFFPQSIGGNGAVAIIGAYFGQTAPNGVQLATFDAGFGIPGEPAAGVCSGGAVNPEPPPGGDGGPGGVPGDGSGGGPGDRPGGGTGDGSGTDDTFGSTPGQTPGGATLPATGPAAPWTVIAGLAAVVLGAAALATRRRV